jgi:hypothetical protein
MSELTTGPPKSPRDQTNKARSVSFEVPPINTSESTDASTPDKKRKKSVLARVFKTSGSKKVKPLDSHKSTGHSESPSTPVQAAFQFVEEPMPEDSDEIEHRFLEAIDQLGIQDEDKRNVLISKYTTPQLRWRMVMDSERSRAQLMSGKGSNPQYFIDLLAGASLSYIVAHSKSLAGEIQNLNVHVRNQQLKWLNDFLKMDGLSEILTVMATISNIQEP